MAWLPAWFIVDEPQKVPAQSTLPAGFVVDWTKTPWQWLSNITENYIKPATQFLAGWVKGFLDVWGKIEKSIDTGIDKLFWTKFQAKTEQFNQKLESKVWRTPLFSAMGMDTNAPSFTKWEIVWDVVWKSALIPWPKIWWSNFLSRVVKNAPMWALKTQAWTLLTEQRFATPTETAIGAWFEWIWWWFGWIKEAKANKILNVIKEADTKGNKSAALARQWIDESQWALSKRWNGSKNVVLPSQKSKDAADTIMQTIKWASTKPQKLYTQVSGKIKDIATDLSPKLQQVKIWTMTKTNAAVKKAITDLAIEWEGNLSTNWVKKIKGVATNFSKAKNLDEVWNTAKQLDSEIPDTIKKGVNLSAREQGIRDAWRATRGIINDHLDETASKIADVTVKDKFKVMSNLFHAKWQISDNIARLTPKVVGMKNKLVWAAKWLAGTAIAGKVLQKMWVFWWWQSNQ